MSGPQLSCIFIDNDKIDPLTTLSYAKKSISECCRSFLVGHAGTFFGESNAG